MTRIMQAVAVLGLLAAITGCSAESVGVARGALKGAKSEYCSPENVELRRETRKRLYGASDATILTDDDCL